MSAYGPGRFQPNDEEKEMYKNYKEDKSKLQNADRFLMKVQHFDFPIYEVGYLYVYVFLSAL